MRNILITGSNRGLGLEFARQYLSEGYRVIGTCRKPQDASELDRLSYRYPGNLYVLPLDVDNHQRILQLPSEVSGLTDRLDLLINNAGVFPPNRFDSVTADQIVHAFRVNCVSPFLIIRAFRRLLKRSDRPLVVNISSLLASISTGAGLGSWADYAYGPSKAALNRMVRQLAIDLRPDGITVVAQNPGWVQTDMGGPEAPLSPPEAVAILRRLFDRLTMQDTGRVLEPNGSDAPW